MSDEIPAAVQPDEGQGAAGASEAPYAEYLNRIPEEVRGEVEPVFRDWDAQTTRRFQEASEYRKAWEPYEQIGVNQAPPEAVQWGLQFYEAVQSNPQAVKEWFEEYAQANNLTPQEAEQQLQQQQPSFDDPYGLDSNAQLEQLLKAQLGPIQQQVEAVAKWQQDQEQATQLAEAQRYMDGQLAELESKHPDEFKDTSPAGPRAMIETLSVRYVDSDARNAIPRAFADWQAIRSQIEKATLQAKVDQPAPAEGGGVANAAAPEVKTLADAGRIAMEQIRASNRAAG